MSNEKEEWDVELAIASFAAVAMIVGYACYFLGLFPE